MNFVQFMKGRWRNRWVIEGVGDDTLEIYIRKSIGRYDRYGEVQLANISAIKPGNGALTRFLDKWEPEYDIMVECILNKRLEEYLIRRGYERVSMETDAPDYLRKKGPISRCDAAVTIRDRQGGVK